MSELLTYEVRDLVQPRGAAFRLEVPRLEVRRGEVLALLGPTGAGKSTLLRLLAAIDSPTGGTIACDGSEWNGRELARSARQRIVMVHQRPLALSGTVRANIELPLRWRGRSDRVDCVARILDQLRLTPIADQSAATLSGGQLQLLALARALVCGPDILLLDEPTANLDPAHVALLEATVLALHRERPMTIVWATHNLFQARRVADRVGLLFDGRIIEIATCRKFFEAPDDPRTADFVAGRIIY